MIPTGTLIALGGNAIVEPGEEGNVTQQYANTLRTMREITTVLPELEPLVITHGNGPQVGNILYRSEIASKKIYPLSLDVCVSDSEGGMGYMIQQTLHNELERAGRARDVVTIITQVVVDPADPAFSNPTKFIGKAWPRDKARRLEEQEGWQMKQDGRHGWRRVVPSPRPLEIVEAGVVKRLAEAGVIVIAAGGGGIPVVRDAEGRLTGERAVVDKDLASALLAREIGLERLVILTAVERVCVNFGQPDERPLEKLDIEQARLYLHAGQFPAGSMGPKIQAAIEFIEAGGREVLISSPHSLQAALRGETGTRITK